MGPSTSVPTATTTKKLISPGTTFLRVLIQFINTQLVTVLISNTLKTNLKYFLS